MAFDPIAPKACGRGCAEHGEVILFGIAVFFFGILHHLQNIFETHNGHSFDEAGLTEPRRQQRGSEVTLIGSHVPELQAFALKRNIVPVAAFIVAKFDARFGQLLGIESSQQTVGCIGHHVGCMNGG